MDDVVRLSVVSAVAGRYRRSLAVLVVIGALLGSAAWLVLAPGWTAASEVLLIGSVEEEEIAAEAQIASSLTVLDRTAQDVGRGGTGADLRGSVQASVVEGSVVRIAATAGTPAEAARLAESATRSYMEFSAELVGQAASAATAVLDRRREDLEKRIDEIRGDITTLQGSQAVTAATPDGVRARAELDRLGDSLTSTTTEMQDVEGRAQEAAAEAAAGQGRFAVLESAVPVGAASPTFVQSVVGGALLLPLLGLVALLVARHTDRRLRDPHRIGEALGAPLLADPPLAVATADGDRPAAPRGPVRRVGAALRALRHPAALVDALRGDGSWDPGAPADRPEDPVRLRRVLDRAVPAVPDARTVLLVPAADPFVRRAAEAVADGRDPRPDVVEVDLDRPRPDLGDGPVAAVVVVAVGTATAWQLLGVAAALAEAGTALRGVVAVAPAVSSPDDDPAPGEPAVDGAEPTDAALAGTS
ncbi:hypothetical protein [Pseudonocardia broussonetiae]|uniref:Polysaccharide chain length determinant N-terminal domain-containing protein n=1 Tax=Pseudonocardia broussonetiae TaxID=2736640 RepID=A0A6M6JIM8_9PSEU|nr:hypothetical protein [Pseudonocardia broussonetiae]QJY47025.1 hypothetical protein HOP40_15375 [Pseudonocardia broussonetiae]